MILRSLTRFWSDRCGGTAVDYGMVFAVLFATRALAGLYGGAISAALASLLPV